ncbi:MAG: 3-carboxy-cis,cis-muconate cycloisomerase [Burkholderiales bacterium]
MHIFDTLFSAPAMEDIFSDRAILQGMLDFEAALARAEARCGLIPPAAAVAIASKCRAELFDVSALSRAAANAGNLAIPLVQALTDLVASENRDAACHVHAGATSQDAIDTGLVLQLRAALDFFDDKSKQLADSCAGHADRHRQTVMAGRTWLQHATPITFGLKAAGWLSAVERHRTRIAQSHARVLVVQFGGASGTLAALGNHGLDVAAALAQDLGLALPAMPWHSQRDNLVEVASMLGMLTGSLGKMARDISLLMQTETGEAFEPAAQGRGGSSTMPHKRNPVSCAMVLAAATRLPGLVAAMHSAMPQEHERGLGGWQAEWQILPQICLLAAAALEQSNCMLQGLEIDAVRMRANLDITQGLILAEAASTALAVFVGRAEAHRIIEQASQRAISGNQHLRDVLARDVQVTAHLDLAALEKLFIAENYTGVAEQFIERVLAARKA